MLVRRVWHELTLAAFLFLFPHSASAACSLAGPWAAHPCFRALALAVPLTWILSPISTGRACVLAASWALLTWCPRLLGSAHMMSQSCLYFFCLLFLNNLFPSFRMSAEEPAWTSRDLFTIPRIVLSHYRCWRSISRINARNVYFQSHIFVVKNLNRTEEHTIGSMRVKFPLFFKTSIFPFFLEMSNACVVKFFFHFHR